MNQNNPFENKRDAIKLFSALPYTCNGCGAKRNETVRPSLWAERYVAGGNPVRVATEYYCNHCIELLVKTRKEKSQSSVAITR